MKAVIQKVQRASVEVDGSTVSAIEKGLCVLVGIDKDDTEADCQWLSKKLLSLRLFADESGPWKLSLVDVKLPLLCVSQFTLMAKVCRGSKPNFHCSMAAEDAKPLYFRFLELLRQKAEVYGAVWSYTDGKFQTRMVVNIVNDGPTTIVVDSKAKAA